jgi:hypothetical protein
MNIFSFNSHFFHWVWGQKSSNLSYNSSIKTLEDNCILYSKSTIYQNNINGSTKTFNDFNFKHCAIKLIIFLVKLIWNSCLAHQTQVTHQVRKTFSSDGRSWNKTEIVFNVFIVPIEASIESFFGELNNCLLNSIFKFRKLVRSLVFKCKLDTVIFLRFPFINSINFVKSNNERAFLLSQKFH